MTYKYFAVTLELLFSLFSNLCLIFLWMTDCLDENPGVMNVFKVSLKKDTFLSSDNWFGNWCDTHDKLQGETGASIGLKHPSDTLVDGNTFFFGAREKTSSSLRPPPLLAYLCVTRRKKNYRNVGEVRSARTAIGWRARLIVKGQVSLPEATVFFFVC